MAASLIQKTESASFYAGIAPQRHVEVRESLVNDAERERLRAQGYMQLDHVLAPGSCEELAACVEHLVEAGVPPVFAFVYDAFWDLFDAIARGIGPPLGRTLQVLPDFWVWRVTAAKAEGGWSPHRDYRSAVVRGADGFADRLNVWVALTDAPRNNACLSLVPRPSDTAYPNLEVDPCAGAVDLPVRAGTALVWDANLLHWSNPADPNAKPRISAAMTLERATTVSARPSSFQERLDTVAMQIVRYEPYNLTMSPELRAWARAASALRQVRSRAARVVPR